MTADRFVLPNAFISAAEDALYHGQFLSRPTIWTVQATAMLTLCGHNVCESDLLSSLLAIGIKTAQALKLHTLGRTAEALAVALRTPTNIRRLQDLELGKRLWWALAQEVRYERGISHVRTGLVYPSGVYGVGRSIGHFPDVKQSIGTNLTLRCQTTAMIPTSTPE
jgi:hypothetical protein